MEPSLDLKSQTYKKKFRGESGICQYGKHYEAIKGFESQKNIIHQNGTVENLQKRPTNQNYSKSDPRLLLGFPVG